MRRITWNSPVILWFVVLSGCALALDSITQGNFSRHYCCIYQTSFLDPLFYLRLFTHVLGHASFQHYANNMMIILLVGPLLEEKYGSDFILKLMLTVAFVTGVLHILISPNTGLLGASGIDFAFILLASITGVKKEHEIPLTLIVVALIYLGQQIIDGVTLQDNVSQFTHIIGGCIGATYGLSAKKARRKF